ncbi:hypothetical protein niasHT_026664 [Heterodera trifolii]|uniref:Uncharacterized protein n=1 Tax=Heterodera trifolii TaxID=157864 RepID=A0ABD2JSM0_9BILA
MNDADGKLEAAQQQFDAILASFSPTADGSEQLQQQQKEQFLRWVRQRLRRENAMPTKETLTRSEKRHLTDLSVRKQLGRIAKRLRELTPLEYCLDIPATPASVDENQLKQQQQHFPPPSEAAKVPNSTAPTTTVPVSASSPPTALKRHQPHTVWPVAGAFADCTEQNTLHVDAFLFDDDDVDQLATDGILRRHFCTKCRSTDVEQFNFISHSLTIEELHHLFTVRLPSLDGKVLVDIGSRLGTVLYAAALYCPRIGRAIGIERDPFLYELQCQIVAEFGDCLTSKIELLCADVRDVGTTLKGSAPDRTRTCCFSLYPNSAI